MGRAAKKGEIRGRPQVFFSNSDGAQRRCKCVRATQCRIHERKVLRSRVRWGMIIRVCFVELSSLRRPHTARSTSR